MNQEKKYLGDPQSASGNFDDADFAIGLNQWTNLENFRIGSTDAGVTGTLESIGSTLLKSGIEPSVTHIPLGSAITDNQNDRYCYFLKDKYGKQDKIMCYSYTDDKVYVVLLSSQVVGGLDFDKNSLVHSGYIINGLLYWTDNSNQLRRINIDAGIKMNNPSYSTSVAPYESPLEQWVITVIRRPPVLPIIATKILAASIPATIDYNYIKDEAFRFSWKYYYRDGEESVLGAFSNLMDRNLESENFDTIKLLFPSQEFIEQDVKDVELVVQFADDNKCFIIKTWSKDNPTDLAEINAHNTGATPLTYYFFNDQVGIAVPPAFVVKQSDSVPIRSQTLSFAKNRLFTAGNLMGYNTPITSSLTLSTVEQSGATTGVYEWHRLVTVVNGDYLGDGSYSLTASGSRDLVYFNNVTVPGFYRPNAAVFNVAYTPPGAPTPFSGYTFYANNLAEAVTALGDETSASVAFVEHNIHLYYDYVITSITVTGVTTTLPDGFVIYKSAGIYEAGIVFYDFAQRHCGVLPATINKISIPDRTYSSLTNTTGITWNLSNVGALNEIPDWAYYYQIVRTKCLRTRFFLQARALNTLKYVSKDVNTGVYTYSVSYSANAYALAIDVSVLNSYSMGYSYQEGDILKLFVSGVVTTYTLPVLGQDGTYVFVKLTDLTAYAGVASIFEIYTPYKSSINEPYFEVSQVYSVNNPTESIRTYSALSGTIAGDVYLRNKTFSSVTNKIEFMSPNDKFWKIWNTVCSKPVYIDKIGQKLKSQSISYSNVFIQGTRINGVSSFEALNEKALPLEVGAIQKLQLTSKVEGEQGVVMLAICTNEWVSIYIEEVQQYGSNKSTNLVVYDDVIGTINVLKGNFGCVNPESITEYRGNVYGYDANGGKIVQYSSGGMFPVSNYKMTRFWKLFSDQYLSMTNDEIEALGSRPFVFSMVDPHHNELLFAIPKLLNYPPKGYLPDYPSTIYPFDIWDGQTKTIVYRLDKAPNFWQGVYKYENIEGFASLQNKLYGLKNGHLYEMNQTSSQCNLFGVQYKPKVMLVGNENNFLPKIYNNISVQSNICPTFVYLYSEYPNQQASDLVDFSFQNREGVWYANILRNKLTPTVNGMNTTGLLTNEVMRNENIRVLLEFTVGVKQLELKYVYLGYTISKGHNV